MRKIFLAIFIFLTLISLSLFFSSWAKDLRQDFYDLLEEDLIYLKDNSSVRGLIWSENESEVSGFLSDGSLFKILRKDCLRIERDFLLKLLKQLI
ncbi:MAG: hypothetical protein JW867_04070 [Candidatus Omnitrophica bacterium]|nr:hypothetical protein [Candidatus Omnitrophota bacterium]